MLNCIKSVFSQCTESSSSSRPRVLDQLKGLNEVLSEMLKGCVLQGKLAEEAGTLRPG